MTTKIESNHNGTTDFDYEGFERENERESQKTIKVHEILQANIIVTQREGI